MHQSLKGHFLVASPHLLDPNFARTVVLMIHHSEDGAFGVVINRPADKTIRQVWERATERPCSVERPINVGGPVSGPLIAVHTDATAAEMQVIPGLYFSAQREHLERLVERNDHQFRLFVGHSGWGKGQLERELDQGAWFTTPATIEDVFDDEAGLWRKIANRIGERLLCSALNLSSLPPDASLN